MQRQITVTVNASEARERRILAPVGIPTPYQVPISFAADGGKAELVYDAAGAQAAALIKPDGEGPVTLRYTFADQRGGHYPDAIFAERDTRFTRAASALAADSRAIADRASNSHAAIQMIVEDTAQRFTYGHPAERFMDGHAEIPHLGCGTAEGSCVDINAYLIAALRSAGFEAGYVTGYFFPADKGNWCEDGHCWVVTRHDGVTLEWDIAHHLKLGTRAVRAGLNPKPGHRVGDGALDGPRLSRARDHRVENSVRGDLRR